MSSTATRPRGRHAGFTFRDWKSIARRLEHEKKADTAYVRRVEQERDTANAENARLQAENERLTAALIATSNERDTAQTEAETTAAENRRLTADLTALRATVQPRDTSRIEDQVTEPIDVRQLREDTPDDYFNRTPQAWRGPVVEVKPQVAFKPKPLGEAPFAMDRPPTTPTDLPGETTLTLRVTAAQTAA